MLQRRLKIKKGPIGKQPECGNREVIWIGFATFARLELALQMSHCILISGGVSPTHQEPCGVRTILLVLQYVWKGVGVPNQFLVIGPKKLLAAPLASSFQEHLRFM